MRVSVGIVLYGLATLPTAARPRRRGITRAGFAHLAVPALVRCASAKAGNSVTMNLADCPSPRMIDRLFDEADLAVAATRIFMAIGLFKDDAAEAPDAMQEKYERMRSHQVTSNAPTDMRRSLARERGDTRTGDTISGDA
jgi:hypothetical protein